MDSASNEDALFFFDAPPGTEKRFTVNFDGIDHRIVLRLTAPGYIILIQSSGANIIPIPSVSQVSAVLDCKFQKDFLDRQIHKQPLKRRSPHRPPTPSRLGLVR
jgi:hypothetical protein